MKKKLQLVALLLSVATAGLMTVTMQSHAAGKNRPPAQAEQAQATTPPCRTGMGPGMGMMGPGMGMGMMGPGLGMGGCNSEALGLTAEQQTQVKAIHDEAWTTCSTLRQSLADTQEKIQAAIVAQPFDEALVRTLAQSQSETMVELTVHHAKTQNQIFALLTPEQQEKAQQMMSERQEQRVQGHPNCRKNQ